jgi:hypothetical protein
VCKSIATRSSTAATMSMSQRCRRITFTQTPSSPGVNLAAADSVNSYWLETMRR